MHNIIKKIFLFLSKVKVFLIFLAWLMFLLVMGTITQKDSGLYVAEQKYFSSFILWFANFIPLPGGYTTIGIISLSLASKLFYERWNTQKVGTMVLHLGALALLFGSLITAVFSYEGSMVVAEGESKNYITDYHEIELVIADMQNEEEITFPQKMLKAKQNINSSFFPFSITIKNFFNNVELKTRATISNDHNIKGMAKAIEMREAPLDPDNEANIPGISFFISNTKDADGLYSIFENMPIKQTLLINEKEYCIEIRHKRTYLPFAIKLDKFDKQTYPGTNIAKSYKSKVVVEEDNISWPSIIEMNHPLRYKEYIFYQSSFIKNDNEQISVLAVVKNIGRIFPYVATIIMCLGLLIHLVQMLPRLLRAAR